jgi:hypothetical protein
MQKNFFLKWIYQLEGKKTDIIDHLREIIHVDIVKNSIDKFKSWRKKQGGATEKDFDRHRRSVERNFYPNGNIAKEIYGLNQEMVNFLIIDEHKTSELLKHKTLFEAAKRNIFIT